MSDFNVISGYGTNIGMLLFNRNLRICVSSMITYVEGPWSDVMQAIHDCHAAVHAHGAPRIATDIRIGTRVDREIAFGTGNDHKVTRVEEILAQD